MSMSKHKLCIIDDNPSVCDSLRLLFESVYEEQFDIKTYTNPMLFLDELLPDWHGCVIIDFFMPYLNGMDLIKELKKRGCQMHCIMISGHGSATVASQALEAGACAFISKPFNVSSILEKINDLLR